jgi:hypothetical protein
MKRLGDLEAKHFMSTLVFLRLFHFQHDNYDNMHLCIVCTLLFANPSALEDLIKSVLCDE